MKLSREERAQRRKLHEEMNKTPPPLVEKDEETVKKLLSRQPYAAEDITKCAMRLFEEYHFDFKKQFRFIENSEKFDEIFEELDRPLKQPLFFVYSKREHCNILFCLITDKFQNIKILYKDPFCNIIDEDFETKIRSKLGQVEFVIHTQKQESIEDDAIYGPMCLRNMKTVLDSFRMDSKNFAEIFKYLDFCTKTDINSDRFSRVMVLTNRISKNEEFVHKLREFVSKLPSDLTSDEQDDADDFEANIQELYPAEMEDVHILLQIIADTVNGTEILRILKNICDILGLNYSKIQSLFLKNKKDRECDKYKGENASDNSSLNISSLKDSLEQSDLGNVVSPNQSPSEEETPIDVELKSHIKGNNVNKTSISSASVEEKVTV